MLGLVLAILRARQIWGGSVAMPGLREALGLVEDGSRERVEINHVVAFSSPYFSDGGLARTDSPRKPDTEHSGRGIGDGNVRHVSSLLSARELSNNVLLAVGPAPID